MPKNVIPIHVTEPDGTRSWDLFVPCQLNRIMPYHSISSNWTWQQGSAEGHETIYFGYPNDYTTNPAMSYSMNDLDGNYFEISTNPDDQIKGTIGTSLSLKSLKFGDQCTMEVGMWTEVVYEQGQPVTKYTAVVTAPYNTLYNVGSGRFPSPYSLGYPKALTIRDGIGPRISFHICKYKWESGSDVTVPVVIYNIWDWSYESPGGGAEPVWVYKIKYQYAFMLTYWLGDGELNPQDMLTPAKTPNATPNGGMGARSNLSADVPFSTADGIHGLSGYADAYRAGVHLVRMEDYAWNYLIGAVSDLNFRAQVTSFLGGYTTVDFSNYIISSCRLGLPVINVDTGDGALRYVSLSNYVFDGSMSSLPPVACVNIHSRFADTDTYTFNINRYSGTFLDFDPYTRIEVHVPYCGIAYISADDCVDGKIEVKYIVDLVTGECVAQIRTTDQFGNTKISASLEGCCGLGQPISSTTFNSEGIKKAVSGITGLSPALTSAVTSAGMAASGSGTARAALSSIAAVPGAIVNTIEGVNEIRHPSNKSTAKVAAGGMSSILGERSLYVAIYHPQDITGFEIRGTEQINSFGKLNGYTSASFGKIQNYATGSYVEGVIDTSGISTATDAEKAAIKLSIRNGVYI